MIHLRVGDVEDNVAVIAKWLRRPLCKDVVLSSRLTNAFAWKLDILILF